MPLERDRPGRRPPRGLTVLELTIVVTTIATIIALAVPAALAFRRDSRNTRAAADISSMSIDIATFRRRWGRFPDGLAEIERQDVKDPWGNPYEYFRIAGANSGGGPSIVASARKDQFLVPVNSDFDLYSKGEDGDSLASFNAPVSRDDIVRAADGAFVGLAADF